MLQTYIISVGFFLMFELEHVSPLHLLGKQINSSKCCSFCRVSIGGIRFSERKCYINTSWHHYIWLLNSLTLQSETAAEESGTTNFLGGRWVVWLPLNTKKNFQYSLSVFLSFFSESETISCWWSAEGQIKISLLAISKFSSSTKDFEHFYLMARTMATAKALQSI